MNGVKAVETAVLDLVVACFVEFYQESSAAEPEGVAVALKNR